jgi:hypothetical protein
MPAPAKRTFAHRAANSRPASRLGSLPEWNLSDLYAGIDDPQVKRDLDRGAAESLAAGERGVSEERPTMARFAPSAASASAAANQCHWWHPLSESVSRSRHNNPANRSREQAGQPSERDGSFFLNRAASFKGCSNLWHELSEMFEVIPKRKLHNSAIAGTRSHPAEGNASV